MDTLEKIADIFASAFSTGDEINTAIDKLRALAASEPVAFVKSAERAGSEYTGIEILRDIPARTTLYATPRPPADWVAEVEGLARHTVFVADEGIGLIPVAMVRASELSALLEKVK